MNDPKDPYKKDRAALNEMVNSEMDNISKEFYKDMCNKIKERFANHLRSMGLKQGEITFRGVLNDLDNKLKVSENMLFEEAQHNYNSKLKKFIKEIEKYLNLKLNIVLQSYNTANDENLSNFVPLSLADQLSPGRSSKGDLHWAPLDEAEVASSLSSRENYRPKSNEFLNSNKSSFLNGIPPSMPSKKRNISISSPSYRVTQRNAPINFASPQYEPEFKGMDENDL